MATSSSDIKTRAERSSEELTRKRSGEPLLEENFKKRRKGESTILLKEEISIHAYFSLMSTELIHEEQSATWASFKAIVSQYFPDINSEKDLLIAYVPQGVVSALERIQYKEIDLNTFERILEKWSLFIQTLNQLRKYLFNQLRHPSATNEQESAVLLERIKQYVNDNDIDLTLAERNGWNVIHIAASYGRIDVLIDVQWRLLPEQLEQYKILLDAETNGSNAKPISLKKVPHHAEFVLLLSEEEPALLKEKQFAAILNILIAHGKEPQCVRLCEQAKKLIAEGVNPTGVEETRGLTLLHFAVYRKDIGLVKHILHYATLKQCEILLNAKTRQTQSTALSIAEYKHYEEILSLLKEKAEIVLLFKDLKKLGKIENKQRLYERIEQFIKKGGNPMVVSDNGLNFLHYAAYFQDANLVAVIQKCITKAQYQDLLRGESQNEQQTPYGILQRQKCEDEAMLALFAPEMDPAVSQSSPQVCGALTFFNPTLLEEEPVPVRASLSPKS